MNTTKTVADIINTLNELALDYTWTQGAGKTGVLKIAGKDTQANVVVMTASSGRITHGYDGGYGKNRFSANGFWGAVSIIARGN